MGAKPNSRGVLNLEAQFAFFRSQHRHPVNAAAHVLLTGPLLFTILLILQFLPLPLPPPLDPALALSLAYAAAYLAARLGFALAWKVVLPTQLFGWAWQVLGHGLFEKRGPMVTELPEVFLMEPFLILLQILNKLFAYEPYPGFSKNVDKKIETDLRESIKLNQSKIN